MKGPGKFQRGWKGDRRYAMVIKMIAETWMNVAEDAALRD